MTPNIQYLYGCDLFGMFGYHCCLPFTLSPYPAHYLSLPQLPSPMYCDTPLIVTRLPYTITLRITLSQSLSLCHTVTIPSHYSPVPHIILHSPSHCHTPLTDHTSPHCYYPHVNTIHVSHPLPHTDTFPISLCHSPFTAILPLWTGTHTSVPFMLFLISHHISLGWAGTCTTHQINIGTS